MAGDARIRVEADADLIVIAKQMRQARLETQKMARAAGVTASDLRKAERALASAADRGVGRLTDSLTSLSPTASRATGALRTLASGAGLSGTAVAGMLGPVGLAVAALTALAAGAYTVTNRMSEMVDENRNLAEAIGQSAEGALALKYALAEGGGDISKAREGLAQFTAKLVDAKSGSAEAAKAFRALGLEAGDLGDPADALTATLAAIKGIGDSGERAAARIKLFGQEGARAMTALDPEALRRWQEQVKGSALVSEEAAAASAKMDAAWARLSASTDDLVAKLGVEFVDGVAGTIDTLAGLADRTADAVTWTLRLGRAMTAITTLGSSEAVPWLVKMAVGQTDVAVAARDMGAASDEAAAALRAQETAASALATQIKGLDSAQREYTNLLHAGESAEERRDRQLGKAAEAFETAKAAIVGTGAAYREAYIEAGNAYRSQQRMIWGIFNLTKANERQAESEREAADAAREADKAKAKREQQIRNEAAALEALTAQHDANVLATMDGIDKINFGLDLRLAKLDMLSAKYQDNAEIQSAVDALRSDAEAEAHDQRLALLADEQAAEDSAHQRRAEQRAAEIAMVKAKQRADQEATANALIGLAQVAGMMSQNAKAAARARQAEVVVSAIAGAARQFADAPFPIALAQSAIIAAKTAGEIVAIERAASQAHAGRGAITHGGGNAPDETTVRVRRDEEILTPSESDRRRRGREPIVVMNVIDEQTFSAAEARHGKRDALYGGRQRESKHIGHRG